MGVEPDNATPGVRRHTACDMRELRRKSEDKGPIAAVRSLRRLHSMLSFLAGNHHANVSVPQAAAATPAPAGNGPAWRR
jgi:hypothetical protein